MIWALLLKYWQYAAIGALALALFGTYEIQQFRIEKLKVEFKQIKIDLQNCKDANTTNNTTIESLEKERDNNQSLCEERLKVKEDTIKKLRGIDEIKVPDGNSGNPILDDLNRMFPSSRNS